MLLCLLLMAVLTGEERADPSSRRAVSNVFLLLDHRWLGEGWEPVDEQPGFGLEFNRYRPGSPGWEFGFSYSSDSSDGGQLFPPDSKVTADFLEIYLGGRKTWKAGRWSPYLGVGGAYVRTETEVEISGVSSGSTTLEAPAFYCHTGAYWALGDHFRLGLDFRVLLGDGELTELNEPNDDVINLSPSVVYGQAGIVIGFSF